MIFNTRGGICIQLNGGSFLIYNNLLFDLDYSAISINRAHGYIMNNTLVGTTPGQYRAIIINSDSISHIYNNILYGFGIGIHLIASDSTELNALRIYHNNIWQMTSPYWYEYNENLSLPIYSGALSPIPGSGELSVAPEFSAPGNHDYTLLPWSLCIDAGIDSFPVPIPFDLSGSSRVSGSHTDLGALEFNNTVNLDEVKQRDEIRFRLYPNPTADHFTL